MKDLLYYLVGGFAVILFLFCSLTLLGCKVGQTDPIDVQITFTWTASGDNADIGTASEYDIRVSNSLITESNWDQATQLTGEPDPQIAGTAESWVATVPLEPDTDYYFALKVADEIPNWSGLSNIKLYRTGDTVPPMAIVDFDAN
jgi:hypothetical protein